MARFPWRALVFPPLVPVVVFALMLLAGALGVEGNVHGGVGVILGLAGIWSLGTFVALLFFLPKAIAMLRREPSLRSTEYVLATAFASLFMVFIAGSVILMIMTSG